MPPGSLGCLLILEDVYLIFEDDVLVVQNLAVAAHMFS